MVIAEIKRVIDRAPVRRERVADPRMWRRPGAKAAGKADIGPGRGIVGRRIADGAKVPARLRAIAGGASGRANQDVRAGVVGNDPAETGIRVLDRGPVWRIGYIAVDRGL